MKQPIYRTILRSYFIICGFILTTNFILSLIFFRCIRNSAADFAVRQAEFLVLQLDNQIKSAQQQLDTLSSNSCITDFLKSTDSIGIASASQNLKNDLSSSFSLVQDGKILVYSSVNDSLFISDERNYRSNIMTLALEKYKMTPEQLDDLMNSAKLHDYCAFPDGTVWLLRPLLGSNGKRAGVIISEYRINDFMSRMEATDKEEILLLSCGTSTLYNSSELTQEEILSDFFAISHPLNQFDWSLTVGLPKSSLYRNLAPAIPFVLAEFMVSGILIIILSLYMTRRSYQPIEQMASLVSSNSQRSSINWDSLFEDARHNAEKRNELEKSDANRQEILDSRKIETYMIGRLQGADISPVVKKLLSITGDEPVMMALFRLNKSLQRDGFLEKDREMEYFVLYNVINEMIFCKYPGKLMFIDDLFIMFLPVKDTPAKRDIELQLQTILETLRSNFSDRAEIIVSDLIPDYNQIDTIYQSLIEGLDYHHFWGDDIVMEHILHLSDSEIIDTALDYGEYLSENRKLMNYLELGEYDKAYKAMEYLYTSVLPKGRKHLQYNIYRMYGLISMITLYVGLNSDPSDIAFIRQLDYHERLYEIRSMEELMQVSKNLFNDIIAYKKSKEKEHQPDWLDKVIRYINEHYADENMNVTSIADIYGLSVPHLSRTFKVMTGKGVLDYIHEVRIQNAKLLLDEGMAIKSVAPAVGYLDSKAMTRIFKRYEGITAEQYKKRGQP